MREYRIGRLNGRYTVEWVGDDGKRRRFRLAAHTAKEAESEARARIVKETATPRGATVAQLWDAYKGHLGQRRQAQKMRDMEKAVLPAFGHLMPEQISVADCRTYIAARRASGRKDGTIRSEMGGVKMALAWAQKSGLIQRVPRMELPPVPQPRERYLDRNEVAALLDGAGDPHIRLAILLMLTTAGRVGAVLELTWDRVEMKRRMIRLATDEVGPRKGRATVPINDTLMAALQAAQPGALSDYVVEYAGGKVGSIKTGFNAAVKRAGIDHCTPHDLRRTAGRLMVENGVPIEEVAQYLGHSNPDITRKVYARFSPDYLRQAAGSLEFGGPRLVHRAKRHSPKSSSKS